MKTWNLFYFLFLLIQVGEVSAQPEGCDKLIQLGDTTVCMDFNGKGRLFREKFYLGGQRIYTRWWHYYSNGTFKVVQKKGKSPFSKLHGPAVRFYPSGNVQYYADFTHGIQTGNCFSYYPLGNLRKICRHNGQGNPEGVIYEFHENGQLSYQARWEDGRLREILAYKDSLGNDLPIGTFKDGTGTWLWQEHGKLLYEYTYKDGRMVKKRRLKQ